MRHTVFQPGDIVHDILADIDCIVRMMEKGIIKLSAIDRPEFFYYQIERFLIKK